MGKSTISMAISVTSPTPSNRVLGAWFLGELRGAQQQLGEVRASYVGGRARAMVMVGFAKGFPRDAKELVAKW